LEGKVAAVTGIASAIGLASTDILHANKGTYVGGDLVDADTGAIDRMLNLN
jgi:NAD(P)-dependent dehydrogenase (short-subunit alcohol dehydrogenase family)